MLHTDFVGVSDKGGRDRLELPRAAAPGEGDDVDAILEDVGLVLLRLLSPIEHAPREEKRLFDVPCCMYGIDRLDDVHLPNGKPFPFRVSLGGELHLREPGLPEKVGDHLLRSCVEECVVDLRLLEEKHLVLESHFVGEASSVVRLGDVAGEDLLKDIVIPELNRCRVFPGE